MTEKMLKLRAAPILSAIFRREGVTIQEKEAILSSINTDPGHTQAIAILAEKLLEDDDQPDIEKLYDLLKEA